MSAAVWHPSPNFGPRRHGRPAPDMVVLHYTAMASAEAARAWLCAPESEVSAHYLLAEDGRLWQLVRETERAWHAGRGAWAGVTDVNSHSIGIELANTGTQPFPEPQMAALEVLLSGLLDRWAIPPERVIAHSDCALGRKTDPGPRFDWRRLARRGLSVWPMPDRSGGDFARDAQVFGYDWRPETGDAVLKSFRLRFRPWATGPLDATDTALMSDLAARHPGRPGA